MSITIEEWVIAKLGDIVDIGTGKLDSNCAEEKGEYPFFTCAHNPLRINDFAFDCEAILLAGNNADGVFHINFCSGKFNAYQRTYIITVKDKNKLDLRYLYYYLHLSLNLLKDFSQGTSTKFLTMRILKDLEISLPPFEEQKKISETLSDLDEKIKANMQISQTLETIGQAVFKLWFVDFEFPDEEGKPYKSSGGEMLYSVEFGKKIPEKWTAGTLADVLSELDSGSRPKGGVSAYSDGVPSIGAESILGLGKYDYSSTKYVPTDYFKNMKRGIVRDEDVLLYKDGAQLGRKSIFLEGFPFEKCCINEHVFILKSNSRINQIYLFFWLDQTWMTEEIRNLNANSAQPGINKEAVKSLKIIMPSENVLLHFESVVKPLVAKICRNSLQNKTLSCLRDALLPRLMSGKIRVPVPKENTET